MITKKSLHSMLVLLVSISSLLASAGAAQVKSVREVQVEIEAQEIMIKQLFEFIENNTDYYFIYTNKILAPKRKVNLEQGVRSVAEVLTEVARQTDVQFRQINESISVRRAKGAREKANVLVRIDEETEVKGMVRDENGEPLPGATILEKGTSNGTITDINGNFSLVVDEGATLVISFLGYFTKDIPLNGQTRIEVTMEPNISSLEEVVVVGYGSQRKKDLTGATGSLSAETIDKIAAQSFEQAIQGRVAGVNVSQSSAAPGGGITIRIRGSNSISGTNDPLYVIDGVPIIIDNAQASAGESDGRSNSGQQNALSSLNPNDIADIQILKDASATAIYGSRGANGVVLITTKTGKPGEPKIEYSGYIGVQERAKRIDVTNAQDRAIAFRESYENAEQPLPIPVAELEELASNGFDYNEHIFRDPSEAIVQDHQVSISGGTADGTNYFLSGGYFSQNGLIKNTDFDRYTFRVNLDKSYNKFSIGNNLTISRTRSNMLPTDGTRGSRRGIARTALLFNPLIPFKDEDGNFVFENPLTGGPMRTNPAAILEGVSDELISDRILGSLFAEYEFLDGLNFRTSVGIDLTKRRRETYWDRTTGPDWGGNPANPGRAGINQSETLQLVSTNTLNYQENLGTDHFINVTGVFELQTLSNFSSGMVNEGFANDILKTKNIGAGQREGGPDVRSNQFEWQIASFAGRAFYSFKDRYLFTFTGRYDGSSRFGSDNRWGFFPSGAVGWRISEEPFLDNLGQINELKLRVSYGLTGNQEIPVLETQTRFDPDDGAVFGGVFVTGVEVESFPNDALKWETTKQLNIGVTSSFLNDRLNFVADYYHKNTEDLLLAVTLPLSSGFTNDPFFNFGSIENRGIELTLGGTPIQTNDLSVSVSANYSRNRNEVTEIFGDQIFGPEVDGGSKTPGNLVQKGSPLGLFYGYEIEGVYASDDEASSAPVDQASGGFTQEAGAYRYRDVNGDNMIDETDRTVIGDPNPDFIYGFNTNIRFKNFDLDITFQGVEGRDILNVANLDAFPNVFQESFDDRWTPQNTDAEFEKPSVDHHMLANFYDSRLVEDGSYFRLRNIVLGYNLPLKKWGISALSNSRIYVSAQNLFTITDYKGYNPEVNSFGQAPVNQGIDTGGYPLAKTYTVGVNLTL